MGRYLARLNVADLTFFWKALSYPGNTSDTKCVGVFHSDSPATGCQTIQFWPQLLLLVRTTQVRGSVPQGCPRCHISATNEMSRSPTFLPGWLHIWGLPGPFSGLTMCWNDLLNSGKHCYLCLPDFFKWRIQLSQKEVMHGAKHAWGRGAEHPCLFQVHPSPLILPPTQKLSKLPCPGLFVNLSLQPPSLARGVSGWGWAFQPSANHLVLLVTSPILRLSRGYP